MLACYLGKFELASILLISGLVHGRRIVDPNAVRQACGPREPGCAARQPIAGLTALIDAVREGYIAIAALLLAHGSDINQADAANRTPLWHAQYMATKHQHKGMVEYLVQKGASLIPSGRSVLTVPPTFDGDMNNMEYLEVLQAL